MEMEMEMEIQHFGHRHPLALCSMKDLGIKCAGCKLFVSGPAYGCRPCKYFLHKSCSDVPKEIHHPFHPLHPLTLLQKPPRCSTRFQFQCYACRESCSGFTYHCSECKLYLHILCASFQSRRQEEDLDQDQSIQHFIHDHPLFPVECHDEEYKFSCSLCDEPIKGSIYVCAKCRFFVHKSCTALPRELHHPFHPSHALILRLCSGFIYHCSDYTFYLHAYCSRVIPIIDVENQDNPQISRYIHNHMLTLVKCYEDNYGFNCSMFTKSIKGSIYVCPKCKFFIHKSCAQLPIEIKHAFHPPHPLILLTSSNLKTVNDRRFLKCNACSVECNSVAFNCPICKFNLDIKCGTQFQNIDNPGPERQIQHGSHHHPLFPIKVDKPILLYCAYNQMLDGSRYICPECIFMVHKSCAELPKEVQHPFHPPHLLKILALEYGEQRLCKSSEKMGGFQCSHCRSLCRGIFSRCVPCELNLHVRCIQALPQTSKHISHKHTLTLRDLLPEDETEEYLCDACEKEKNPKHFFYYCAKCNFASHINFDFGILYQKGDNEDLILGFIDNDYA
ncbi:hypothetical protein NMG60_11030250 [Bertholletia excelsa]